jgi:hypothetical protein
VSCVFNFARTTKKFVRSPSTAVEHFTDLKHTDIHYSHPPPAASPISSSQFTRLTITLLVHRPQQILPLPLFYSQAFNSSSSDTLNLGQDRAAKHEPQLPRRTQQSQPRDNKFIEPISTHSFSCLSSPAESVISASPFDPIA